MDNNNAFKNQVLTLTDGKTMSLNGVKDIIGFADGEISLECTGGKITVEGNELKIESLSKDGGNIIVTGEITGIYRTPLTPPKRGIFSRG